MPVFPVPKALRLFAKVAAVYLAVLALWIFAAKEYHMLLGRAAARLIPLVVSSAVENIWYDQGVRYKISFPAPQTSQVFSATGVVDTLHYGYPIITFLVLAWALPGPPWKKKLLLSFLGATLLFFFYSIWMVVAVYEFLGQYDAPLLKGNFIARVVPPAFYTRYEIPFLVFMGQVLPITLYGLFFFRPFIKAGKKPVQYRRADVPNEA